MAFSAKSKQTWRKTRGPLSEKLFNEFEKHLGVAGSDRYIMESGGPLTSSAQKLNTISFANTYVSGSALVACTAFENTGVTFGMSTSDATQSIVTVSAASEVYYYNVVGQEG